MRRINVLLIRMAKRRGPPVQTSLARNTLWTKSELEPNNANTNTNSPCTKHKVS